MAFKFDPSDIESDFELIPAGTDSEAIILAASEKETKKGGSLVHFKLGLVGGDYDGRQIFGNVNTLCPTSEKATKIGRSELARICASAGLPDGYDDASELVGRSINIRVTVEEAQDAYPAKNGFRIMFSKGEKKVSNATDEQKEAARKAVEKSKLKASKGGVMRAAESSKNPWDEADAGDLKDIPFLGCVPF